MKLFTSFKVGFQFQPIHQSVEHVHAPALGQLQISNLHLYIDTVGLKMQTTINLVCECTQKSVMHTDISQQAKRNICDVVPAANIANVMMKLAASQQNKL